MKILLATSRITHIGGGIVSYNQELLRALGPIHEFFLLVESKDCKVEGFVDIMSSHGHGLFDYHYSKELVKNINGAKFDIIINSDNMRIAILAPFINAPIITIAHFFRGIMADEAGYNAKYISKAVVLSQSCQQYLKKKFSLPDEKIEVVYNFVAPSQKPYNESKANKDTLSIVYPGGGSIVKSSDIVLKAVYKLLKTKLNFKFIWIGNTLTYASYLSPFGLKRIEDFFEKDPRLEIKGKVCREEAEKIISSANVFLLPSRGEGCPMSLLEAMREGCIPVISDANHGSLDVINESKTGLIIKQGNGKELFMALKHIIESHKQYTYNYQATYNYSKEVLSRESWVKKMQKIFSTSLTDHKDLVDFNRYHFFKSVIPFVFLMMEDKFSRIISIIKYRIRVDLWYIYRKFL